MKQFKTELGKQIYIYRTMNVITQQDLAERFGLSSTGVWKLETAKTLVTDRVRRQIVKLDSLTPAQWNKLIDERNHEVEQAKQDRRPKPPAPTAQPQPAKANSLQVILTTDGNPIDPTIVQMAELKLDPSSLAFRSHSKVIEIVKTLGLDTCNVKIIEVSLVGEGLVIR